MDGGSGPLCFVDDQGRYIQISEDHVRDSCNEWSGTITVMNDIYSGMVTLTLDQYRKLPAVFLDVYRFYQRVRTAQRPKAS